jgi:Mg2+ and Co2+ transporter CorA
MQVENEKITLLYIVACEMANAMTIGTPSNYRLKNKVIPFLKEKYNIIIEGLQDIDYEICLKGKLGEILYEVVNGKSRPMMNHQLLIKRREAHKSYYKETSEFICPSNIKMDFNKFEDHEKDFLKDLNELSAEILSLIIDNMPVFIEPEY